MAERLKDKRFKRPDERLFFSAPDISKPYWNCICGLAIIPVMSTGLSDFEKIERRFSWNIKRVRNLIQQFEGAGTKSKESEVLRDVLRAAVVTLHAATEDLVRQSLIWKLPETEPQKWTALDCGSLKIAISDLLAENSNLAHLVRDIVKKQLEKKTYNNTDELIAAVKQIGISEIPLRPWLAAISEAMSRRHHIVHQSDRTDAQLTDGHGVPRKITAKEVTKWTDAEEAFGTEVLNQLSPPKPRVRVKIRRRAIVTK